MLLIDQFNRRISYLRISITDRCNLRCLYCSGRREKIFSREEILTYEEIFEIIKIALSLGIEKFRLTGGEPLLRQGLLEFLEKLSVSGIKYSLTTNGLLLKKYASLLAKLGLGSINVSLDTLEEKKFKQISGKDSLKDILLGIKEAEKVGLFPIKINTVAMKGINENEIENFIHFFRKRKNFILRFIEYMPFKVNLPFGLRPQGRRQGEPFQKNGKDYFFPLSEVEEKLGNGGLLSPFSLSYNPIGPARYYQVKDKHNQGLLVGFITPRSCPFCGQCNRLRLTSDGKLRPCLASPISYDLKKILRQEKKSGEVLTSKIKRIFFNAVQSKPKGHQFQFLGEMITMGG